MVPTADDGDSDEASQVTLVSFGDRCSPWERLTAAYMGPDPDAVDGSHSRAAHAREVVRAAPARRPPP